MGTPSTSSTSSSRQSGQRRCRERDKKARRRRRWKKTSWLWASVVTSAAKEFDFETTRLWDDTTLRRHDTFSSRRSATNVGDATFERLTFLSNALQWLWPTLAEKRRIIRPDDRKSLFCHKLSFKSLNANHNTSCKWSYWQTKASYYCLSE